MSHTDRRRMLRGAGALAALAVAAPGLAACVYGRDPVREEPLGPPPPSPPPLPQFRLDVAEIQVVPAYAPPPGGTDSVVPFAPATALETWAKTHVRAVGRQGVAWIVIRNASVTARRARPEARNWRDWFRRQPFERYDAVLELELQIKDDAGRVRAQAAARATHVRFLMDDYRDYRRERLIELQRLTDEVIVAALRRLEVEVRANLAAWLR